MEQKLWKFTDNQGSFESFSADKIRSLYFPLCNEALMSSITPDLHGDIKTSQNSFLLTPVSRIDLENSRCSRNFWVTINKDKLWSATGVSKDLKQIQEDRFKLEAGLLWHKVTRENRKIGLRAEILSFVPASPEALEIMVVTFVNITSRKITFVPTAAIPIYARGANNLRDHRHVTSLLQRIILHRLGVVVKPTLMFDESGHKPNKTLYFVLGWDERFNAPQYIYPTQEMFCGEEGDLEAPAAILNNALPGQQQIQGKEAMGALRFRPISLKPGQSRSYIVVMGITEDKAKIQKIIRKYKNIKGVWKALEDTKNYWLKESSQISVSTGNPDFDNWFRWVSIQPVLRRIFGCSFLPDFDYGKGGRGWRDLWQDCLGLVLNNPNQMRSLLINNFSGVRTDGSNATIIGKKAGEFMADRNNISRVWMDHGIWPLITLDLFLQETGQYNILLEEAPYFCDHQLARSTAACKEGTPCCGNRLKTSSGKIYKGTLLEHLLVQHLVQFFNVGSHNHIRLEDADWNDGLDMAKEKGESVAFSAMYAHNLALLSRILFALDKPKVSIAQELLILLRRVKYDDAGAKLKLLQEYYAKTQPMVSGKKAEIDTAALISQLTIKSRWMMQRIRKKEWLQEGFFNGYYDNKSRRVEGSRSKGMRMILASQVFPVMSGAADGKQIKSIIASVRKYLYDKKLGGVHLNTDFHDEQQALGRAFSFVYGDKENGAAFSHMAVMYAYALYQRGFVKQGWEVLRSTYEMALDTERSKIYPCLPEYFNLDGRGMYAYLTGSASWFVLTFLTQVFGVKGEDGDLRIEPKLCRSQFDHSKVLRIKRSFAGRPLEISFFNPRKLNYGKYKIIKASLNSLPLPFSASTCILLNRGILLNLPSNKINKLNIYLG